MQCVLSDTGLYITTLHCQLQLDATADSLTRIPGRRDIGACFGILSEEMVQSLGFYDALFVRNPGQLTVWHAMRG